MIFSLNIEVILTVELLHWIERDFTKELELNSGNNIKARTGNKVDNSKGG